ncbi:MAG: PASTA domain-containing protein [Acidobacteriota bacterium]
MWRKLTRALGCLGYLGVLGGLFAVVAYAAFSAFVRGGVTPVPDLRGLSETEAMALLTDQGLDAAWADEPRYDESVPRDHVLRQDPGAGVYVKRDTTVTLTLSRGPRRIAVPDLGGQAVQAAQVSLSAAGLVLGRVFDVFDDAPVGTVVAQQPVAGENVAVDAPVDLFVTAGANRDVYVMPDVVGRPYDAVRRFFEARGIRTGRVGYVALEGIEPGVILRQYPLAGHPLKAGDVLSLDVSADPQPIEPESTTPPSTDPPESSP